MGVGRVLVGGLRNGRGRGRLGVEGRESRGWGALRRWGREAGKEETHNAGWD